MKILHLISGGDTGGAKTHVFALLRALSSVSDVLVKIVCFTKGVFYDELQFLPVQSELAEQKNRMDLSVLDRVLEIIGEGYEIIHCHGARANFIAYALKKRGVRLPFITTIHSDYLLDFDVLYKKLVYTTLNVIALKKFDYYIAVSSDFKRMLISRGFRPNAVFTVYNGMDYTGTPDFCDKETFASRIGIRYDPSLHYIGLIGRHDHVKGHDVFLKAARIVASRVPNARFLIAGDGDGRKELVKLCDELSIADKVTFCGFVKDIYSFLNFIDINTLTSRCESFPYVLLEGARMKKPTVSSRVGGIPDLIVDGECGLLFERENERELAEKLIRLIEHPSEAATYGENLYRRATSRFSSEALAKRHLEIYRAVLRDAAEEKRYDVSLSGYYGFGNCGDDALLHAILNELRAKKPDIRINVFSASPRATRLEYGVDSVYRFRFCALGRTLRETKLLINGGGSLIQDATSAKSLWYYLYVMHAAHKKGCKIFIYANGLGPIKKKHLRPASAVLRLADGITLREPTSLEELRRMNIPTERAEVTADPAIALEGAEDAEVSALLEKIGADEKENLIGVSIRAWGSRKASQRFYAALAASLDRVAARYHARIVFLPMMPPDDTKVSEKAASLMRQKPLIVPGRCDYRQMIGLISKMRLLIGMRLHALIFAAAANVPSIGIVYDPKVTGFLSYAGMRCQVDIRSFDGALLEKQIDDVLMHYDEYKSLVERNRETLTEKAKRNAAAAIALLSDGSGEET